MKIKEYYDKSIFSRISTNLIMSSCPCEHIKNYKADYGLTTYRVLHAFYVSCVAKGSRKRKAQEVECYLCCSNSNRIHACLYCVFFGCFNGGHIHEHALTKNHTLAVDIKYGNVFCFECGDYTYDEEFEAISKKQKRQAGKIQGTEVFSPWEPSKDEIDLLKANDDFKKIAEDSWIGLRGLVNLGQTCFMNCIVQVLVHTPLLRDYFLSDKHICHFQEDPETTCLACVMFNIFQEFYSGVSAPYVPHKLVYVTWTHATHLVGYAQQDAQEFYIAMLEVLHRHCQNKEAEEKLISNDNHCTCIIDQIFTGFYQSDVVCLDCKNVSTIIEPFWDISLDLGATNDVKVKEGLDNSVSLTGCIERYTRAETLPSQCGKCKSTKRTKQLTIKKLPVVISFHLKRLAGSHKKNSTHVSFPEYLDMSPFTTELCGVKSEITNEAAPSKLDCSENTFTLFAVVNHIGTNQGGHYVSFIRQHRDRWYQCNDDVLSKASITEVLASEGYLLFYHKQVLEYGKNPRLQNLTTLA